MVDSTHQGVSSSNNFYDCSTGANSRFGTRSKRESRDQLNTSREGEPKGSGPNFQHSASDNEEDFDDDAAPYAPKVDEDGITKDYSYASFGTITS